MTRDKIQNEENDIEVNFVIDSLASGGAEKMLLRQIQYSNREPTVYILGGADDLRADFIEAGATVINVGDFAQGYVYPFISLYKKLESSPPDVLHAHLPGSHIVARVAGKAAGVPKIISTHHNIRSSKTYQSYTGQLEKATRVIDTTDVAVSNAVKNSQQLPIPGEKWEVIYNAIDAKSYHSNVVEAQEADFQSHDPVFLNIGRYTEQKSQENLIRAMPEVIQNFPDAAAVIVGWGELEAHLQNVAAELGISDHIYITGKVPSVFEYYAAADVFVLPSQWEGLPIVLLEAMAAELPIVASNVSGIPEMVNDDFGILVPPEDTEQLSEALISTSKRDTDMMGAKAFAHVKDRFSVGTMVEAYERIYQ